MAFLPIVERRVGRGSAHIDRRDDDNMFRAAIEKLVKSPGLTTRRFASAEDAKPLADDSPAGSRSRASVASAGYEPAHPARRPAAAIGR
jgi:hypothetical protein